MLSGHDSYFAAAITAHEKLYASPKGMREQIMRAAKHIRMHYASPLNIADMASSAHLSTFYFIRAFRWLYGRTPHQYLMSVRVEAACRLLQSGMGVQDVCHEVGFESVTSFSSLFRKHYGCPPGQFSSRETNSVLPPCK
ncbi:helix-turn-helix transcriptional regulator [Nostoc ellipsosporum NOK]|nr:helix-turn-helix transcriptional regulator [Nostoc ellipsosporum NOK]